MKSLYRTRLMILGLSLLSIVVYWQTGDHSFINIDDPEYVYQNAMVQKGLSGDGIAWAFGTSAVGNWHPVTWLSHMTDITLFGPDAGRHHRVNLLFHILNTGLLFLVLSGMTGSFWRSGFVAALFAVHPLHVESVAWISERKDLLSAFFGLLSLRAYLHYVKRPATGRYLGVVAFFALSLMSKPMLVTLPFVLLLLDLWPLERVAWSEPHRQSPAARFPTFRPGRLLLEKLPMAALALAVCGITLIVQQKGASLSSLENYPLWPRVATAITGYGWYLLKMVWPVSLSVFYPHPWVLGAGIPGWEVGCAALALLAVSWLSFRDPSMRPWNAVGWAWYLVTLLPVIGLVQVGLQRAADRYAYLPLIGPFIMIAWGGEELLRKSGAKRFVGPALAGIVILSLTLLSFRQTSFWRDSVTLHKHALGATPENWYIRRVLGGALIAEGQDGEALLHLKEALRIRPDFPEAHFSMGFLLARNGAAEDAVRHYQETLRLDPANLDALRSMVRLMSEAGKLEGALPAYRAAVARYPDDLQLAFELASLLGRSGHLTDSIAGFRELLRKRPEMTDIRINFGNVLLLNGEFDEAIVQYQEVLRRNPEDADARQNLALALREKEKRPPGVR